MSSNVVIGQSTDTGPTLDVTLTRDAADTHTDFTTATSVVLILPDTSTQSVTKTSATTSLWLGTIRYAAWWPANGTYPCQLKPTFADGTFFTVPTVITFLVGAGT